MMNSLLTDDKLTANRCACFCAAFPARCASRISGGMSSTFIALPPLCVFSSSSSKSDRNGSQEKNIWKLTVGINQVTLDKIYHDMAGVRGDAVTNVRQNNLEKKIARASLVETEITRSHHGFGVNKGSRRGFEEKKSKNGAAPSYVD